MASLARGESSTGTNPVLDLFTVIGSPKVLTDVAVLEFRIFDISTDAKKAIPVQVFPLTAGTFFTLDPTTDFGSGGHRLSTGRYFAPYTVDLAEPIGDHKIEWRFQATAISPFETTFEEFFVLGQSLPSADAYCGVSDVRAEGFTDPPFTDARINILIALATRYVDKVTGRWFTPRTFDDVNPFLMDGNDSRTLHLQIPIIQIDKLSIQSQGFLNPDLTVVDIGQIRSYNRHLSGMTQPDDRENPKVSFISSRIPETVLTGLFPSPRIFPKGRQNIFFEGVFGYTDPDGTAFGKTPDLIRQVTCRLVTRDLRLDSDACEKLMDKVKFRISSDKEGKSTIKLQNLWLKGAFTGDSELDNILMMFKRPIRIGIA